MAAASSSANAAAASASSLANAAAASASSLIGAAASSSQTSVTANATSNAESSPPRSPSQTSSTNSGRGDSLSAGVIAGIAVGAGLVVLATLAGLVWYIFRLKRALKVKRETASYVEYPPGRYEKDGLQKFELNAVENQIVSRVHINYWIYTH